MLSGLFSAFVLFFCDRSCRDKFCIICQDSTAVHIWHFRSCKERFVVEKTSSLKLARNPIDKAVEVDDEGRPFDPNLTGSNSETQAKSIFQSEYLLFTWLLANYKPFTLEDILVFCIATPDQTFAGGKESLTVRT